MKTIPFTTTITAGIAVMLTGRSAGIEAPADNAPPPAMAETAPAAGNLKPQNKAETAYLGVVSSPIPAELAAHLPVKTGEGIIVRAVMPDGPAAKAGIAVHDIITRVGDQAIGTPEDLSRAVTTHKPGDTIHLHAIHEGNPVESDVTLGVRPQELAGLEARPLDHLNLDGMPEELANRVRGMIQGNLGGLEMQFGGGDLQLNEAVLEMKERLEKAVQGLDHPGAPPKTGIDVQQGATIRMLDEHGSIELKSNNGGKEVTLLDKDNNITWTGPWDTEQDKAAAPDDVRQRVERLNLDTNFKGEGLRLRMLPDNAPR